MNSSGLEELSLHIRLHLSQQFTAAIDKLVKLFSKTTELLITGRMK